MKNLPILNTRYLGIVFLGAALTGAVGCTVGDAAGTLEPDGGVGPEPDAGDVDPGPVPGGGPVQSILVGNFAPLPEIVTEAKGVAQMVRTATQTTVDLTVTGLLPDTATYKAHLHALPCAADGGGGHYMMDPLLVSEDPLVIEANEIWPVSSPGIAGISSDADGVATARVTVNHPARGDAMSVVIHDAAGKMLCADLLAADEGNYTETGTFGLLSTDPVDMTVAGSASLIRTGLSTEVSLTLTGLTPATEYVSHVHALPCEIDGGGGHYKIDPLLVSEDPAVIEANEIWPLITVAENGSATGTITVAVGTRYDAQSVVVHRVVGPEDKPKVVCANLVRAAWPPLLREGTATLLPAGVDTHPDLAATATMTRGLDGTTMAEVRATAGLTTGVEYMAHVHALPCAVEAGGGHYKKDPAVISEDPVIMEPNEMWMRLTAGGGGGNGGGGGGGNGGGGGGGANATVMATGHMARSEAQSVVIHDPANGDRLACIDLL